jgi:hypothetical protein
VEVTAQRIRNWLYSHRHDVIDWHELWPELRAPHEAHVERVEPHSSDSRLVSRWPPSTVLRHPQRWT